MFRIATLVALILGVKTAVAEPMSHSFDNIDGGVLNLSEWSGQPVLVVNTASQCGFTHQYEGLQTLYDTYRSAGLVVLAVPSDDFRQELDSAEEVKAFCEMTFGLDMPMADITSVKGRTAHPFYQDVREETGFTPKWNFNKVLIAPDGSVAATWGANTKPMSGAIRAAIEEFL